MKDVLQDLLYGCRMMINKPAVTIVAALSLALGIGANTVIFSLINTTLLRPLPYEDPGKIMTAGSMMQGPWASAPDGTVNVKCEG